MYLLKISLILLLAISSYAEMPTIRGRLDLRESSGLIYVIKDYLDSKASNYMQIDETYINYDMGVGSSTAHIEFNIVMSMVNETIREELKNKLIYLRDNFPTMIHGGYIMIIRNNHDARGQLCTGNIIWSK